MWCCAVDGGACAQRRRPGAGDPESRPGAAFRPDRASPRRQPRALCPANEGSRFGPGRPEPWAGSKTCGRAALPVIIFDGFSTE
jgi:hypothetical protein